MILTGEFLRANKREKSGVLDLHYQLYLNGYKLQPCGAVPMISFDEDSGILTIHRSDSGIVDPNQSGKDLEQLTLETPLT